MTAYSSSDNVLLNVSLKSLQQSEEKFLKKSMVFFNWYFSDESKVFKALTWSILYIRSHCNKILQRYSNNMDNKTQSYSILSLASVLGLVCLTCWSPRPRGWPINLLPTIMEWQTPESLSTATLAFTTGGWIGMWLEDIDQGLDPTAVLTQICTFMDGNGAGRLKRVPLPGSYQANGGTIERMKEWGREKRGAGVSLISRF